VDLRVVQRQATSVPSDIAAKLASVDRLATGGVNGLADDFATAAEQSQHIDQPAVMVAKPGPYQFAMVAARAPESDRLAERNRPVFGDRRALFGLVQASVMRRISGISRRGQQTGE